MSNPKRANDAAGQRTVETEAVSSVSQDVGQSALSFEQLYEQYATDVLRFAYFYLGDRSQAEDVVQDVFVRLLTAKPDLHTGYEKSWLLKVALNRCRDLWKGAWFKRVVLGHPAFELIPGPDVLTERTEKQAIMSAVNSLPAGFKEIILLHYYQGYGISEIAAMLEVPEGTVSSRLSRARLKLEKLLDDQSIERGGKEA